MKPNKICIVSLYAYHFFNPKSNSRFGGAELQLYYLATELVKDSRFEVNFIVGDFGQPDFEIRQGVKLYKFFNPVKSLKYLRVIFGILKLLKLLKKINADIYIQRAAGLETGIVALFCKLHQKRFVYMTANDEDVQSKKPSYFPRGLMALTRWFLFKVGLRNAKLVLVQNKKQKDDLKKYYNKEGAIRNSAHIIPENISDTGLAYKRTILWVGKADRATKQPEIFIELARAFPKEKFTMICPESNDRDYFENVKEKAQNLTNLEFTHYVPFSEIDNYFSKARVFVNTSRTEGFPNTFVQAAKNRTPILSLSVNPEKMLEKYQIGRCAEGDFEKLKKDLEELLKDKELLQTMAENAYKYAKEHHDIKKIIERDKELLINILRKNNAV